MYVSVNRDITAARTFFTTAIAGHREPEEVVTDRAAALAKLPWVVRYTIDGRHRSKSFRTRIEADQLSFARPSAFRGPLWLRAATG